MHPNELAAVLAAYSRALSATLGLGAAFIPALARKLDDDARDPQTNTDSGLALACTAALLAAPSRRGKVLVTN